MIEIGEKSQKINLFFKKSKKRLIFFLIPTSTYTNHQLKCATHILIASVSKKSPTCHCEERSNMVAQPFARNERYGCGIPPAGAI